MRTRSTVRSGTACSTVVVVHHLVEWFNDNAGAVTAAATVALAVLTACYAVFTGRILKRSKQQADAAVKSLEMSSLPVLRVMKPAGKAGAASYVHFILHNIGNGPAVDVVVHLVTWDEDSGDVVRSGNEWYLSPIAAGEQSPTEAARGGDHHSMPIDTMAEDSWDFWRGAFDNDTPRWGLQIDYRDVFNKQVRVEYRKSDDYWKLIRSE